MMNKRRIGILGGISHESTIVYYQRLIAGYYARFQDAYYPEIVIYSLGLSTFHRLEDQRRDGRLCGLYCGGA